MKKKEKTKTANGHWQAQSFAQDIFLPVSSQTFLQSYVF